MINSDRKKSLAPEYFEAVYDAHDDPWNFASSEYEAAKYAATLAALPREKYESAFEIGCSIGVLTERLAARCENLLAVDVNEKALAQARQRCEKLPNVNLRLMDVRKGFPEENFDLILISEVGYYLSVEDWKAAIEKIITHLNAGGNIVLVHWTPPVDDYPQTGDAVHDSFAESSAGKLRRLKNVRAEKYRLDVWEKF
ncbi:MAG: nodulation S family protein [Acidobacteriota bacterium]|nr:nodulation S family protein [Acidobacteriota bacterium]